MYPSIPGIDFWRWSVGFLRRADSRVSLNWLRRHSVPRHQVSELILVPLGQSEKAMGLESPIESWLASATRFCAADQRYTGRKPEPRAYVQGLDVRTMSGRGRNIFLDILFIESNQAISLKTPGERYGDFSPTIACKAGFLFCYSY